MYLLLIYRHKFCHHNQMFCYCHSKSKVKGRSPRDAFYLEDFGFIEKHMGHYTSIPRLIFILFFKTFMHTSNILFTLFSLHSHVLILPLQNPFLSLSPHLTSMFIFLSETLDLISATPVDIGEA